VTSESLANFQAIPQTNIGFAEDRIDDWLDPENLTNNLCRLSCSLQVTGIERRWS
jgi:hypothetical protein